MDLFAPRVRPAWECVATVKQWVVAALALPESATVMVTELACTEPGCPPLETVIAVLDSADGKGRRRQHTFHKALTNVSWADVIHLANVWEPVDPPAGADRFPPD